MTEFRVVKTSYKSTREVSYLRVIEHAYGVRLRNYYAHSNLFS
jgi:hypothetical protein